MKQSLMLIPPAQAEALYDAALENAETGNRSRIIAAAAHLGEWDDQGTTDEFDDERFADSKRPRQGSRVPLRVSFRPG